MFEILIPLPLLFVERCNLTGAALLDQFRHSSGQARGRAEVEDFFRRGQCGEQFQNIGGAVKAGLTTGIEFPETQFQDFGELLLPCTDLLCEIVRQA
jgi:hypothetical protein